MGTHHDLPNGLVEFEHRTNGCLGSADQIARDRTLLRYYRAFLPPEKVVDAVNRMGSHSVAHLKFQLGLLTSRFRANHPLKACAACMDQDRMEHGWAFWHLEHQFPGVWWCDQHARPLQESVFKATGVGRFLWNLPTTEALRALPEQAQSDIQERALASLAATTRGLVAVGETIPWSTDQFWTLYQDVLYDRGLLTESGRLRLADIVPDFLQFVTKLRGIPELSALPDTADAAAVQLGRLLRPPRTGTHPLRHAILIDWLFGSQQEFLLRYRNANACRAGDRVEESAYPEAEVAQTDSISADGRPARLLTLLAQGLSLRAAADVIGIDYKTAAVWAARSGITVSRRPKVLRDKKFDGVVAALWAGDDKASIAGQFGISIATVTHTLRSVPGLQDAWHRIRFDQARQRAQESWLISVTQYPTLGVKLWRSLVPAAYAWLYRNDREWLRQRTATPDVARITDTERRINWNDRDTDLSSKVQRAALALAQAAPGTRLFLWQLYQAVPDLKAKLNVLHRLPLTRQAIDIAIGRRPSSAPNSSQTLF